VRVREYTSLLRVCEGERVQQLLRGGEGVCCEPYTEGERERDRRCGDRLPDGLAPEQPADEIRR
jgi:hypothetical protein